MIEQLIASARPSCWPQGVNLNTLIAELFILQNLTQTYGSFAPSWSITNEMFYYLFYGVMVCVALRFGIRPTTLGMSLCLVLALILDWIYFFQYQTGYVRVPGCSSGWGSSGFRGRWSPSTASGFAALRRRGRPRRSGPWCSSWRWRCGTRRAFICRSSTWFWRCVHLDVDAIRRYRTP